MTSLAPTLEAYFTDRLIRQRRVSPHTIASYRDTFRLLFAYINRTAGMPPSKLELSDLDAATIGAFLQHLEQERGNTARTRNIRLAAIHSFFHYCALRHPEHAALTQRVLAIPPKRATKRTVTFLAPVETQALLDAPNRSTWAGRRDHALLLTAVQTGLRISELLGLTRADTQLATGAHVRTIGKGRKERVAPLTKQTVAVLRAWLRETTDQPGTPLFPSRDGGTLTRDAIERRLAQHVKTAQQACPALRSKRVTMHTMRHTAAMNLLAAGIEFSKALGRGEKGATQYLINDERFLFDGAAGWPAALGLTPTERTTPFFPQDIEYEYRWVTGPKPPKGTNHLGNPAIPFCGPVNWPYGDGNRTALDEWNGYTVAEFLASRGASTGWQRLYAAENGTEVFSTTALAWLIQSALDWDWGTTYYLDGGLDQIPRTLADSVVGRGAALQLNSPVRRIDQTSTGASVTYRDPGGTIRTLAADRVVLTPTFTVLREKVELSGAALPADKRHWIDTLQMMPVTRISLQVNNRFWHDEGVEGLKIAGTDTPIERIWHSTNLQPGQSGIMQAYLQHQNAVNASAPADKLTWMRDQVAPRLFPQVTSAWNGLGMAKLWHQDEWERGGWVSPKAHEFLAGFHVWGRQEGRIHFAGDSTSVMAGWMQGGIESGQRAACEVATAL